MRSSGQLRTWPFLKLVRLKREKVVYLDANAGADRCDRGILWMFTSDYFSSVSEIGSKFVS